MRYRIVKGPGGYHIENSLTASGPWHYVPMSFCLTYWGARFKLWRAKRNGPSVPFKVIYEDWEGR